MKVTTVIGARPQFIKAAAVSRALSATPGLEEVLVHTGQHYDENMSDVFFEELLIPRPQYHLGIGSGQHGIQTGRMLEGIERIILDIRPDWLLVYGDTNSTLAGALAAAKLHVPVAHVEAGLRSFNRRMPEEINRVVTDHLSTLLFAPTDSAVRNLEKEGMSSSAIRLVGDVMYDAAVLFGEQAETKSSVLDRLGLTPKKYLLATIHRAENTDDPQRLAAILGGLGKISDELPVLLPLHPRTRATIERCPGLNDSIHGIRIVEPVGYLDMVMLEKNAIAIATDSGGVQKEAFFYKVPCVTLRDETEWVELVESGWNHVTPPISDVRVYDGIRGAIGKTGKPIKPYGDGTAAEKIAGELARGPLTS